MSASPFEGEAAVLQEHEQQGPRGPSVVTSSAGTIRCQADSFCSARAWVRSKKPVAPMLGQVESDGLDDGGPSKIEDDSNRLFSIRFFAFSSPVAAHGVTQKPTTGINQGLHHNWL
jgi:hypothetical protein